LAFQCGGSSEDTDTGFRIRRQEQIKVDFIPYRRFQGFDFNSNTIFSVHMISHIYLVLFLVPFSPDPDHNVYSEIKSKIKKGRN